MVPHPLADAVGERRDQEGHTDCVSLSLQANGRDCGPRGGVEGLLKGMEDGGSEP